MEGGLDRLVIDSATMGSLGFSLGFSHVSKANTTLTE